MAENHAEIKLADPNIWSEKVSTSKIIWGYRIGDIGSGDLLLWSRPHSSTTGPLL